MFFDGLNQTCVRFKRTSVGLRCADYSPARKVGRFPCKPKQGLKGGGRSQWAIRGGTTAPCGREPKARKPASRRRSRK